MANISPDKTQGKRPDVGAAIEFLQAWFGEDPWPVSAAMPKARGSGIKSAATFGNATEADCRRWIMAQNYKEELETYFQPNPLNVRLGPGKKGEVWKASQNHVRLLRYLWVDLDPPKGYDKPLADWQTEVDQLIAGVEPRPTWIIDSGRGRWVFWRISNIIVLDGENGKVTLDAKQRMKTLERMFPKGYADSARDSSRIARLPGTVNHKTGQLARVMEHHPERMYPLAVFVPHPDDSGTTFDKADPNAGTGIVPFVFADDPTAHFCYEELPIADDVKDTIRTGGDIPKRFKSRSEAVWFVIRALLKIGTPDAIIQHILLDPDNGISSSILEHQGNRLKFVMRQIERARLSLQKFETDPDGKPLKHSQRNVHIAIAQLGVETRYNEFSDRVEVEGLAGFKEGELEDKALNRLWLMCDQHFKFRPTQKFFETVVIDHAMTRRFHPVLDYLSGLKWDGTPRIDTWLQDYGQAEDSEFIRAVGAIWFIAAVRRVRQPGVKFDEILVLENPKQGTDKSTAFNTLAVRDEWFSDNMPLGSNSKEVIEYTQGIWVMEAADLHGMGTAGVNRLKAFLSRRIDKARMAYGRLSMSWPRQWVPAGTTNSQEYLEDQTGNRRFWPVLVGKFDIATLKRDRDQLWAEAAHREAKGESIRLNPSLWEEAAEEQAKRTTIEPYIETLGHYLSGIECGKIAAVDLWKLVNHTGHQTQKEGARLTAAMSSATLGWRRPNSSALIDIGGKKVSGWVKGEQPWPLVTVFERARETGGGYDVQVGESPF